MLRKSALWKKFYKKNKLLEEKLGSFVFEQMFMFPHEYINKKIMTHL